MEKIFVLPSAIKKKKKRDLNKFSIYIYVICVRYI